MSHLSIIKEAYDACGINYVVLPYKKYKGMKMLFFVSDEEEAAEYKGKYADDVNPDKFMEFAEGEIASY